MLPFHFVGVVRIHLAQQGAQGSFAGSRQGAQVSCLLDKLAGFLVKWSSDMLCWKQWKELIRMIVLQDYFLIFLRH